MARTLIFLGGDSPHPSALPAADLVIAADGGLDLARALDLSVDVVIGDFDSVTPDALDAARRAGAEIICHPQDKDVTDFALALDLAIARQATHITIAGGVGGRLDHLLGNTLLLGAAEYRNVSIEARFGDAILTVIHTNAVLTDTPGAIISLLPIGGAAHGIITSGLRWDLNDESLTAGISRGISNEFTAPTATIAIGAGTLLAVQPGGCESDHR